MPSWRKVIVSGSDASLNSLYSPNITGSLHGTASYATQALSSSFATTASYITTLNQNVLITGSVAIGVSSLGPFENTLTLGARDNANEGGQLGLNAPGGTYTSASFIDIYQNQVRVLRGTNAGSTGLVTQWNLHTLQMQLPAYTAASSFPGTATANLAVDSSGNVITVSTAGGSVFPYTGNAVITGSLTTTGVIYAQPNGGKYFQGGDDAGLYDINVSNTMGIYGEQDSTIASIKLGSGGGVISGKGNNIGIGTTNPTNGTLEVNGNVYATSFTGSLLGTASYATQALSASYAPAGNPFPYTGSAIISGSLEVTGSFYVENSIDSDNKLLIGKGPTPASFETAINWRDRWLIDPLAVTAMDWSQRIAYDPLNASAIDWANRFLLDSTGTTTSVDWGQRSLVESAGSPSINWDYPTQTQAVDLYSYTRKVIPVPTVVENFSYLSNYGVFNPAGEILEKVTLDGTVVDYDLVYLETDAKWYPVDQTTDSSSKLLGIAYASGSTKDKVLLEGTMVVNDSALTDCPQVAAVNYGLPVYIKTGAPGLFMSTSAPGNAGDYVRVVGHVYHQSTNDNQYWVMKFRPSNDWYVI